VEEDDTRHRRQLSSVPVGFFIRLNNNKNNSPATRRSRRLLYVVKDQIKPARKLRGNSARPGAIKDQIEPARKLRGNSARPGARSREERGRRG